MSENVNEVKEVKEVKEVNEVKEVKTTENIIAGAKTLTTEHIIKCLALDLNVPQAAAAEALDAFKNIVFKSLAAATPVQLTGFFSVKPIYRKARVANNIATKQPMTVEENMGVSITAGTTLKRAVSELNPKDFAPKAE